MELGLYTFADIGRDAETGRLIAPEVRMRHLLEEIVLADQVGLDVHHCRRARGCAWRDP
jgi:hypothetical protein